MTPSLSLRGAPGVLLTALAVSVCIPARATAQIERRLEQTFRVDGNSVVTVRIGGGPIEVTTGQTGSAEIRLQQTIKARTDGEADDLLKDYDLSLTEKSGQITLIGQRRRESGWGWSGSNDKVRLKAYVTVPPNVRLDLHTSGGPIAVRGDRSAPVVANTSGGSILVDGGQADMTLDTSGGTIEVGRVLSELRVHTSGGSIRVNYVGPDATDVQLDTSGGTIDVGVDPAAKLSLSASTSGGSISVTGLTYSTRSISRSSARGELNGGGGRLKADTSGGNINVHDARR